MFNSVNITNTVYDDIMKNNAARRERERGETKLRIIEAARKLFTGGGGEALTLRQVARRIEYSATTIYLHFPNKEALVGALCAADFAVFSRILIQAERLGDPLERLRTIAASYVDFGLQYPNQYRAMFITPGFSPSSSGAPHATATEERTPHDFLYSAVFKALAAGVFKPEYRDVPLITQTIWSGLHGAVCLHQVRAKHPDVSWRSIQELIEMLLECLLNGMVVPSRVTNPGWRRS